ISLPYKHHAIGRKLACIRPRWYANNYVLYLMSTILVFPMAYRGHLLTAYNRYKKIGSENRVDALMITSDTHFSETYRIPLLAGQFFSSPEEATVDNSKLVINNKAAK